MQKVFLSNTSKELHDFEEILGNVYFLAYEFMNVVRNGFP